MDHLLSGVTLSEDRETQRRTSAFADVSRYVPLAVNDLENVLNLIRDKIR
jgi:hypothetical protein